MARLLITIITFAAVFFATASCYYDNEEALYPSLISCDTTAVTFSGKIAPILANNCLFCHSNAKAAFAGNNIRLQVYDDVLARTTAISGSIKHTGTYSRMPKNGGKLNDCSISLFDIWIRDGAQNK